MFLKLSQKKCHLVKKTKFLGGKFLLCNEIFEIVSKTKKIMAHRIDNTNTSIVPTSAKKFVDVPNLAV